MFEPAAVLAAAVAAAGAAMVAVPAHADSHALILWIGDYAEASARLPGLDNDARNARRIAEAMGVPASHITELKNRELTRAGLAAAVRGLADRIRSDDRVFVYYSGHGSQVDNAPGEAKPCSEAMVAQDLQLYDDKALAADLRRLAAKASQVVMLNDSCFSGGQATRRLDLERGAQGEVPKFLPLQLGSGSRRCGEAINQSTTLTRTLEVVPVFGAQVLYIAAAGEDEVSFATPSGSPATQAWTDCLLSPATDADHSGSISGEELRACAQARIDRAQPQQHQTITVVGNGALPMVPVAALASAAAQAPVSAARALADLRASSDAAYRVALIPGQRTLRIGRDTLDFEVRTNRGGYLYVIQVGSDGQTFNLLFPNRADPDNRVAAGIVRLPRERWRLRAGGPAGTSHLIALVSAAKRDFAALMSPAGPFAQAPATGVVTRNLLVEAAGSGDIVGRFGTSEVVPIEEVP
jgi:hypothetical protein